MGEVYAPKRLARKRKGRLPDIYPEPIEPHKPPFPSIPEVLSQEILEIKNELKKIKQALKEHGMRVE
ncbi:MAG: hypothetical protein ABIH76_00690 [Candidatus Bathyarchaeota archaeon]